MRLFEVDDASSLGARVSFAPPCRDGWLELLSSGLTFDLEGLSPAEPVPQVAPEFVLGFEGESPGDNLEAVNLVPSDHIAGGAGMQPVMRAMAGLAANLVSHLPVRAVACRTALTCMDPAYFTRMVITWLGGGAFPALGLTGLQLASDGSVASKGLAFFAGQEMQLESRAGESATDAIKIAIRVVDYLVRTGPIREARHIDIGEGHVFLAEPSKVGKRVWIWRDG